jgi:hypothetical protein
MKTEDLISTLAADVPPVPRHAFRAGWWRG